MGIVLFATMQGIAALQTAGMLHDHRLDGVIDEAITRFLRASRTAA